MKTLTPELLKKYTANPLVMDEEVRNFCKLRSDRYYTVSVWPDERAGRVMETNQTRTVVAKKISKSDQK